jgi:hypothetical protein
MTTTNFRSVWENWGPGSLNSWNGDGPTKEPASTNWVDTTYCKGLAQEKLGWRWDALRSYQQFIAFGPDRYAEEVEHTKKRVRELEGE